MSAVASIEAQAQKRLTRRTIVELEAAYQLAGVQMRALVGQDVAGTQDEYSALATAQGWIDAEFERRGRLAFHAVSNGMCPACWFVLGVVEGHGPGFCRECGEDQPSEVCACGNGPFFHVEGARFGQVCGDCRDDLSRAADGWTPENSRD